MEITGKITGIKYKLFLTDDLEKIEAKKFNINQVPTACIIIDGKHSFAISKWVSPKRTRSYPYERVYNPASGGVAHNRRMLSRSIPVALSVMMILKLLLTFTSILISDALKCFKLF